MSVKVSPAYMVPDSASTPGYECVDCGKLFRREAILRRHREDSHPRSADTDTARRCRCTICRRPFANRTALDNHVKVVHGTDFATSSEASSTTTTRMTKLDGRLRSVETGGDAVCPLPIDDCCVDDEICISADDSGADEFQTSAERTNSRVLASTSERPLLQNKAHVPCKLSAIRPSAMTPALATADMVASESQPSAMSHQWKNNNNCQIRDRNILLQQTAPGVSSSASSTPCVSRSMVGPSNKILLNSVDSALAAVRTSNASCADSDSVTSRRVSADTTTPMTGLIGSTASACRTLADGPKSAGTRAAGVAYKGCVDLQQAQKSPQAAETFRGEVRKPGEESTSSRCMPTPTPQKIIFYVKSEPNHHHQQIAYCAAESVSCGSKAGACQFVCPMCSREFVSEKYLSMHISSLHRTAGNDVASVMALETAVSPRIEGYKLSVPATPGNAADIPVSSPATASGALAATHPTPSASVPGSKSHWTCNICQKTFAQNSSYKNHIRTHSDDRPYVCGICSIGFKERYHLKKHELFKHTTTLNETCRICGKRFKDSTAVRAHERIHSDIRPYGCMLCGKTFKTSECLWHHENRSKTCGKMASRTKQLGVHAVATAAAGGLVTVPRQRQRRASVDTVTRLPRSSSNIVKLPQPSPSTDDLKPDINDLLPSVTVCSKTDSNIKAEVAELSNAGVGACESDEVVVKTEPDTDLFDVSLSAMLDSSDPSFGNIWPTLDDLDPVPLDYSAADNNGCIVSSPEAPLCSSPDTTDAESTRSADEPSFIGMTSLGAGGGISGATSKRYDCVRCDKRFASAATLSKHLQVHDEVRPYRCATCDIGFKLKVHLKKHNLYRHSEEYPCECSICGKRFKDSSAVRLHERIHSTARPFQCAHCGKSFKTRENLWGHRNRGPCEQRSVPSIFMTPSITSHPVSEKAGAPQLVPSNVRLFHSAEFGPILGVPINANLVFAGTERAENKPGTMTVHQLNVSSTVKSSTPATQLLTVNSASSNLRRISAVRVGDTTRLAVSKISPPTSGGSVSSLAGGINGGLSFVSVPTAVVTPIKRDMIDDRKLSSLVISTPSNYAGHVINRKRSGCSLDQLAPPSKLSVSDSTDGVAETRAEAIEKCSSIQRLLSSGGETLLSPNMEQNLTDALSALAGSAPDTMIVGGDCLPPIGDASVDWSGAPSGGDYGEVLGVSCGAWDELMSTGCDQILTSTDDDDVLSDGDSLSDYHRLVSSPSLGHSVTGHSPTLSAVDDESNELSLSADDHAGDPLSSASDTMWCNWAPENDLGGLLL